LQPPFNCDRDGRRDTRARRRLSSRPCCVAAAPVLLWIAALLRARLAAHALLQLPDRRFPWAPDDGLSASPSHGDGCAGLPYHANIPHLASGQVGDPARFAGALLGGLDGRAEVQQREAAYSGLLDHLLALPGMIAFPTLTAASPSFSSQLSWPSSYVGPMTWLFLRVSSTFWWFSWLIFLVPSQLWQSCSLPS
jgi:hypothetical protein